MIDVNTMSTGSTGMVNVPVINVHDTNNDENKEYLDAGGTGKIPETIKVSQEKSWEYPPW